MSPCLPSAWLRGHQVVQIPVLSRPIELVEMIDIGLVGAGAEYARKEGMVTHGEHAHLWREGKGRGWCEGVEGGLRSVLAVLMRTSFTA